MKANMTDLKSEYVSIPIPAALDDAVRSAIERGRAKRGAHFPRYMLIPAAALFAFMAVLNVFPATAKALAQVPVLESVVSVLTFGRFEAKDEAQKYEVSIEVPRITGLSDPELESGLNEKYLSESKALYDEFMNKVQLSGGQLMHEALDAGYSVKARTDNTISILHYVVRIAASGAETQTFDTIDTKDQLLLTLPGLFKDASYVQRINENILAQMQQQMKEDDGVMYFIGDDGFQTIDEHQQFYINEDHQLVIVFDEYAVAPGCMGVVEFTIPTKAIADLLVSEEYIR